MQFATNKKMVNYNWLEMVNNNVIPDINYFKDFLPKTMELDSSVYPTFCSNRQQNKNYEKNYDLISAWLPLLDDIKSKINSEQYLVLFDTNFVTLSSSDENMIGVRCSGAADLILPTGNSVEVLVHYRQEAAKRDKDTLLSKNIVRKYNNGLHNSVIFPVCNANDDIVGYIGIGNFDGIISDEMKVIGYLATSLLEMKYNNYLQIKEYSKSILDVYPMYALLLDQNSRIMNANDQFLQLIGLQSKDSTPALSIHKFLNDSSSVLSKRGELPLLSEELAFINPHNEVITCKVLNQHEVQFPGNLSQLLVLFKKDDTSYYLNNTLNETPLSKQGFQRLLGETFAMKSIKHIGKRVAKTKVNVLIEGPTGTGKELLAEAIHIESGRSGPFIPINCGAIPRELIMSELFGYEAGAFTGAKTSGNIGAFEMANNGTIFLDEIGEMPLDMQVSLLRCLENKTITRLGGHKAIELDVRIIAATNRDLREEVASNKFREDLYYRLNVFNIKIPPLKERRDDIPCIVKYLLEELCLEMEIKMPNINESFIKSLMDYDWPGNVRELRNIIEYAVISCQDSELTSTCLPSYVYQNINHAQTINCTKESIEIYEKNLIMQVMEQFGGDITKSAKELGMSRPTLYRKLEKMGIDRNIFSVI